METSDVCYCGYPYGDSRKRFGLTALPPLSSNFSTAAYPQQVAPATIQPVTQKATCKYGIRRYRCCCCSSYIMVIMTAVRVVVLHVMTGLEDKGCSCGETSAERAFSVCLREMPLFDMEATIIGRQYIILLHAEAMEKALAEEDKQDRRRYQRAKSKRCEK